MKHLLLSFLMTSTLWAASFSSTSALIDEELEKIGTLWKEITDHLQEIKFGDSFLYYGFEIEKRNYTLSNPQEKWINTALQAWYSHTGQNEYEPEIVDMTSRVEFLHLKIC